MIEDSNEIIEGAARFDYDNDSDDWNDDVWASKYIRIIILYCSRVEHIPNWI